MRIASIIFLILVTSGIINGQIVQSNRYEKIIKPFDINHLIIPAEEHGLIIVENTEEYQKKDFIWKITSLSKNLELKFENNLTVDSNFELKAFEHFDQFVYLFFLKPFANKTEAIIVKLDVNTGGWKSMGFKNDFNLLITHIEVIKSKMVIGGYYNNRPSFLLFDLLKEKVSVVPGYFNKKGDLLNLEVDDAFNFFKILIAEKDQYGVFHLKFKCYDENMELVFESNSEFDEKTKPLNASSYISESGEAFFIGTFGNILGNVSQGLFFAKASTAFQSEMKTVYFTSLERFFDFLKPKRAAKIIEKGSENKGTFKTKTVLRRLGFYSGNILALLEIYKIEKEQDFYSTSSFDNRATTSPFFGRTNTGVGELNVVEEIEYLSSSIVAFNVDGSVNWENGMSIEEVKKENLQKVTSVVPADKSTMLLYKNEDGLVYKKVMNNSELVQDSISSVKLLYTTDVLDREVDYGNIGHWYDSVYFAWGYHNVKNSALDEVPAKRRLFYIVRLDAKTEE